MQRTRTLFGVGGILAALLFLALVAGLAHRAEGQDNRLPAPPAPTAPETVSPVPPSSYYPVGQATPPAPPRPQLKGETIGALMSRLEAVKAKKVELERVEKELTSTLGEKLKEQKQRLQKLGVQVEENALPVPAPGGS